MSVTVPSPGVAAVRVGALGAVSVAVMQSSANRSGEPAVSSLARVPESIRRGVMSTAARRSSAITRS